MKLRFKIGSIPRLVYLNPTVKVYCNPLAARWYFDFAVEVSFLHWGFGVRITFKEDDI